MSDDVCTMCETIARAAADWADRPAVISDGRLWTYADVAEASGRLAAWLKDKCGVGPDTRVAIAMRNRAEIVVAYCAAISLGATVLPVNYRLGDEALAHVLREGGPACLVADEAPDASLIAEARELGVTVLGVGAAPEWDERWDQALAQALRPHVSADVNPDAPAVILYTSGTTGLPKGAVMPHRALVFNIRTAIAGHGLRPDDVHLLAIPYFVPTACYTLVNLAAYQGAALVMAPDAEMSTVVPLIERWRCTTFFGVPTMFFFLTAYPRLAEHDLRSLRLIAYSGSPMPVRTIRRLRELFPGVLTHNFFGLTETIAMTHVLPSADADVRPESIGKLLPGIAARIVGEDGQELPPGQVGELVFRRDVIIPEYWRRPGLLEESIREGWFHTGDLASVDEEGYFYVHGRSKDLIIVAGQNVYALEVEQVIMRLESVREVAVVGVPATGSRRLWES
ncbi:MAG: AMP-binding protein [Armatimonadetes bacterium]|nr:AMP-binding protein [Armatimonadota bacterium]